MNAPTFPPAGCSLHFDERYWEKTVLGDGAPVLLRLLRAADRELVRAGFERLSPETRRLRFFSSEITLSEKQLAELTELDGIRRFALCAVTDSEGEGRGLGVARFVRDEVDSEVAEAAITVVDDAQGKGLGTLLLQRLAAAANERGVRYFMCEFLARNQAVRHLVEQCEGARFEAAGEFVRAVVPVPETDPRALPAALDRRAASYRLLTQSAEGGIVVRFRRLLVKWQP